MAGSPERPPRRPRPVVTRDNTFFWEGVQRGELLLQRCAECGGLRHPPTPMCPRCRSLAWDTQRASGRGIVYSYCIAHEPPVPGLTPPYVVALVELAEGPRLVSNLLGVNVSQVRIGMPVRVEMVAVDPQLTLPLFHPADDD
jgi:3-oxo-4,17-pregnadiene-20-carboxyl-CoA hydratase alpha subunit